MEDIIIREYTPGDDAACKALEDKGRAKGSSWIEWAVRLDFVHYVAFDTKAGQYEDHKVLVAASRDTDEVLGVVCVAVKRVVHINEVVKAGYLFDLRIDETVQGRGVGRRLSTAAEDWAWSVGVTLLYLTVNKGNDKATALYKKLGYGLVSHRNPDVEVLFGVRKGMSDPSVETLRGKDAVTIIKHHLERDDLYTDVSDLVSSPHYHGTLVLRDIASESTASLSLWNGNALNGVDIKRIVLPHSVLSSRWFRYAVWGVLSVASMWCLHAAWIVDSVVSTILYGAGGVVFVVLTGAAIAFARFAQTVFCVKQPKLRGRLFAPFHSGPEGPRLFKRLVKQSRQLAAENGFATLVTNLDTNSPLRGYFGFGKFRTEFFAKTKTGTVGMLSPENFFDPRDI